MCAISKTQGRCAAWRDLGSGCPAPGCGRLGSPGACFHGAAAGSLMRRSRLEVLTCPRGYQDQASSEAFGWRADSSRRHGLPGLGFLRPGSRDRLRASIPAVWSRPIDPVAAVARLSLSQAGDFTGCLLSGDLPCTVTADGHRYLVTSPSCLAFAAVPSAQAAWCGCRLFSAVSPAWLLRLV